MARTGELFQIEQTGYVSPIAGASIWLSSNDRYISFGSTAGASGYGIRDNAGVMEFKNLLGAWTPMGSGGGGSPGGSNTQLQRNAAGSFGGISGATSDGTAVTFATDALIAATLKAASSGGFLIEASNGTDVGLLGAGNTANVEWYGNHNFDTATQDTIAAFTGAGKTLGSLALATYPSLTELARVKGVTSAIQTQLDAKVDDGAVTTSGLTMATSRILGRTTASAGAIEELTAGSSLSLSAGSLNTIQDIRTTANPQFATIELGAATDTTLSRVSAGVIAVEGVTVATASNTLTLSGKTLTEPKFVDGGFIADANGNEMIIFDTVASAVNEVTLANAATGANPKLSATGGDTNIGIDWNAKGTGTFNLRGNSTQAATLRLYEDTDDGSNYTSFKVGTQSGNIDYTLPTAAPASSGYVLSSTTAGVMSWAAPGSSTDISCRVYQTGTTALTTSWVACAFAAENFDTDTMHDNSTNNTRITFTTAGKYWVGGNITCGSNSNFGARIRLNGTTVIAQTLAGNSTTEGASVSTIYDFAASDYVELQGNANSFNSSGDATTNFAAFKIN